MKYQYQIILIVIITIFLLVVSLLTIKNISQNKICNNIYEQPPSKMYTEKIYEGIKATNNHIFCCYNLEKEFCVLTKTDGHDKGIIFIDNDTNEEILIAYDGTQDTSSYKEKLKK